MQLSANGSVREARFARGRLRCCSSSPCRCAASVNLSKLWCSDSFAVIPLGSERRCSRLGLIKWTKMCLSEAALTVEGTLVWVFH